MKTKTKTTKPETPDTPAAVDPLEGVKKILEQTRNAQKAYSTFSQKQVDIIFREAAMAANAARIPLAKAAVEETGMGIVEDKVIKNHFASEFVYNKFKNVPTCEVIERDATFGIRKVAEPIGVLAGVIPTTNPTSTAIFKALIALKTRNGIVFSPHPRAKNSTIAAAKIVLNAAVKAGAPEHIVNWIEAPSLEATNYLMKNADMTLATGGPGMVQAAYSSGKPAIGVGAGNTPAVVDETANVAMAVNSVLISKTFDNGMICASEQSVIVVEEKYKEVYDEFKLRGAYILNKQEKEAVGKFIMKDGKLNAAIVGQPAHKIAEMAGVKVSESAKVLIGEASGIGLDEPFSIEKLSPVLALYKAKDYKAALDLAEGLVKFAGRGHTAVLYTDISNTDRIEEFGSRINTGRVLINQPSSHGAIGDIYNFRLEPSLTLGCGSWGGNAVSENVGVKHLLNIKTISERRENMLWFRVPEKVYFKRGCLPIALGDLKGKERAFIVTDKPLFDLGMTDKVTEILGSLNIECEIFHDVLPDPDLKTILSGVGRMDRFKPDVIIALGGGSPMDAAKIMWLMYEHPDAEFGDMAMRFMDIRKRVYEFPKLGSKATMVAIPTTSGTGSEVTPFAVVTDSDTGKKYPIADYELTPDMAICDVDLVMTMPKSLTAFSGIDALTHALEAMVAVTATEYTNAMALESSRLLVKYLPRAYEDGQKDVQARSKVHNAATMAGMAFANAFLGVCHSMAHKLGAKFHLPHGLANALLINEVIKFNAEEAPTKQAAFAQYEYPDAKSRYARVARYIGLEGKTDDDLIAALIAKIDELKEQLNIPKTIYDAGVSVSDFYEALDELSDMAFDDQCTGCNPRYPLISEIRQLYINAFGKEASK